MRSSNIRHASVLALLVVVTPLVFVACSDDDTGSPIPDQPGSDASTQDTSNSRIDSGSSGEDAGDAASDAIACSSDTTSCVGDNLVVCGDAGAPISVTPCALGCAPGSQPACLRLSPSNIPATECDAAPKAALTVAADTTLNTDADCDSTQAQGAGAPDLCIKRYSTVTIDAGKKLTVSGSRALVLLSASDMLVAGTIEVGGKGAVSGPGTSTLGNGGTSPATADGAGGAGHAAKGAAGSTTTAAGAGGTAGAAFGVASLVPLVGGASGGSNGAFGAQAALGGGGGGGVQLVSCKAITIEASGIVHAGGGGGAGGPGSLTQNVAASGGGGGGSGGAVLLEAPEVTVAGVIAANGGGGGGGGVRGNLGTRGASGKPGDDAKPSAAIAPGGANVAESGGGGSGGAGATAPTAGGAPTVSTGSGGAGGGAAGLVRVNVRSGKQPTVTGATISPPPSLGPAGTH